MNYPIFCSPSLALKEKPFSAIVLLSFTIMMDPDVNPPNRKV